MKKSLIVLASLFLTPQALASFSDVPTDHPYSEAINWAQENKIIQGFEDGTFKPDQKINRAELTKIIIEANFEDAEIYGDNCFPDVKDEWFAKYVCTAKREGIVKGYEDGGFKPAQNINFVEISKFFYLTFCNKRIVENAPTSFTCTWQQEGLGGRPWYHLYANFLSDKSAIPLSIKNINYNINRSEATEIFWRIKNKIDYKSSILFHIENFHYHIKDNFVYFDDIRKEEIDSKTFKNIGSFYAKDYKNIYYLGDIVENTDNKSFKTLNWGQWYAKDRYNVYYCGKKIPEADPNSFISLNWHYAKDEKNCYWKEYAVDMDRCNTIEKENQ